MDNTIKISATRNSGDGELDFRVTQGYDLKEHLGIFLSEATINKFIKLANAHGWTVEISYGDKPKIVKFKMQDWVEVTYGMTKGKRGCIQGMSNGKYEVYFGGGWAGYYEFEQLKLVE